MGLKIKESLKYLKSILSLVLFVLSVGVYGQRDTIYVDENDKPISKEIFNNKLNSPIYSGLRFDADTLILQKIEFKYNFGNITPSVKNQLFKLLNKRHQIDTTKTLVIHYQDTLRAKSEFSKISKIVYYDSLGKEVKTTIKSHQVSEGARFEFVTKGKATKRVYHESYRDFIYVKKLCYKSYKKYDKTASVLHFYNINNGHPNVLKKLRWYQDYGGLLKKLFFQDKKKFYTVIIKPSGEFFIEYHENYFTMCDLLNPEKWNTIKVDFEQKYKALNNTTI